MLLQLLAVGLGARPVTYREDFAGNQIKSQVVFCTSTHFLPLLLLPWILPSFFSKTFLTPRRDVVKAESSKNRLKSDVSSWFLKDRRVGFECFRAKRWNISSPVYTWVFWGQRHCIKSFSTSHWWLCSKSKKTEFWTVWFFKINPYSLDKDLYPNNYTVCISSSGKLQWNSSWVSKNEELEIQKEFSLIGSILCKAYINVQFHCL